LKIEDQFAVSKQLNKNGFYIGCHPYLTRQQIQYVVDKNSPIFRQMKIGITGATGILGRHFIRQNKNAISAYTGRIQTRTRERLAVSRKTGRRSCTLRRWFRLKNAKPTRARR